MLLPHIEQDNAVSLGVDAGSRLTVSGIIDGTSNTVLQKVGEGTLLVNGTAAKTCRSTSWAASLGGTGVVGATNVRGGRVAPGTSPGILTVAGDMAFAAGSSSASS